MASKFRINDNVIIIAGKDKGCVGILKKICKNKVLVSGVNIKHKHQKSVPSNNIIGGILKKECYIDISNISYFSYIINKKSKVGFKYINKKKVRYLKINNLII